MKRYMFVNYGDEITIQIDASETVGVLEMLTAGPIEQVVETHTSSPWNLRVPSGAIYGFVVDDNVSFTNPDEERLKVYVATSKNPWPPPPPPPPRFADVLDYNSRFAAFLLALDARRPASAATAAHAEGLAP